MIFKDLPLCFYEEISMKTRKYRIFLIYFYIFNSFHVLAITKPEKLRLKEEHERKVDFSLFQTKCFKYVGCFNNGPPFFEMPWRPISLLPENVTVNFALYTPESTVSSYNISLNNDSISESPINSSFPIMVLIPGFLVNYKPGVHSEMFKIKNEVLKYYSYNVIVVDWTRSNNAPYGQAVANGRLVGALIAYLLQLIKDIKGINYDEVHLVGHSLGAHVAGWAGERINKLGRITGLDPAGPYFQHAPDAVRLDTTDAKFVDVIHTNGADTVLLGFGLYQAIGDVDFYPNGGYCQPECERKYDVLEILQERSCDHSIAKDYFQAPIHACKFTSVACKDYDKFDDGKCTKNNSITDEMGFYAKPIPNETESRFYLKTTSTYPFC